jgi:serine/threonine protein kinase
MKDAWVQVTPSEYPWEREGLAFLKERLPDHEPFRAWANFEFLVDGTVSEVDVLVLARKGIFLVELKGWPGRITGDAGTWQWTRPNAVEPRLRDNPYILANRKAKRLKGLLSRQKALRGQHVPFIRPLIFLSDPDVVVSLSEEARAGVTRREDDPRGELPGVIAALTKLTADEQRRGDRVVDRPMAKLVAAAIEQAGIRPSQKRRQVGDLQLGELLDEGTGYQDHIGVHPRFPAVQHRVRIYGASELATEEDREQLGRAARREYELLHGVSHRGIVRAQSFVEHELGPALVFERDPGEIRLDHFLQRHHASLTLFDRLNLVRDLAEAVDHAHGNRLFHRALSPRSVLVVPSPTGPRRFSIINWQTGARDDVSGTALTIQGTRHPEQLIDAAASPYLAPEALTQPDADPALLDVFSLGAIAFHVFCGRAAAESLPALIATLQRDGALEVSSVLDGAGAYLAETVREATRGDATRRSTMQDLLEGIALIEDEITAPPEAPEETAPEHVTPGDLLGGHRVKRRLGRGSTALAFLVESEGTADRVIKVANDPERNSRLRDEGEVLAKLRHPAIIEIHGEPLDVADRTALLLEYAAEGTLAQQLRRQGGLSLGNLQDWGEDLLSGLAYLEQEGIPHRDIKPENCGIAERGKSRKRRLVLLDFSLARAGSDQLEAGTRPYLDPFLGRADRPRWDVAADRFSAAVVLHEMATGTTPFWSAPGVDPRMVEVEASVQADALPREIARPLTAFLERALRRDARERFDTADDMLRAWRLLFDRLDAAHAGEAATVDADRLRAAATLTTSVTAIGLSARAVDAAERLEVLTVGDLFGANLGDVERLRGVGLETRRELVDARSVLRRHLDPPAATTTADDDTPDVQALDALVAQLVPKQTRKTSAQVDGLRRLLTLDELPGASAQWPSQTDVAASLEVTRARVQQISTLGRERWRRLPAVTRLREELAEALDRLGGLAVVNELEAGVASERGPADATELPALARAAVRSAIEAELAAREEPRFAYRRSGAKVLVAAAGGDRAADQRALDYVLRLGDAADRIAAADTLLATTEVRAALRVVTVPDGQAPLSPERLVTLAAAASRSAAASARLELHPRGMDPERALRLGRGALLGADALTVEELQRRISARFPEAAPLPDRPALDAALGAAGLDLVWNGTAYEAPGRPVVSDLTSHRSSETRLGTAAMSWQPSSTDPQVVAARSFETRLQHAARDGGLLVLMTSPHRVEHAAAELPRFAVTSLDLDALLIAELKRCALELGADWDRVVAADAARDGNDWNRLGALVARAVPRVEERLVGVDGTVALRHLGMLTRYGHFDLVERLRDRLRTDDPLRGLWLLVGADGQRERPLVDGRPVPILTPNEVARIPSSWLSNLHRSSRQGQAA